MSKSTCPCEQIYASATSQSSAITISGDIVTANASATASSAVSYEDALSLATKLSTQLASNDAQHDANVIDQTLTIVKSRSLIPSNAGITIGSKASPYSQIYTAKGLVLSSNSPGNEVILNSSNNKLYANGAQVYTSADPQSDASGNTFYGTDAGQSTTGTYNTAIGYIADVIGNDLSNSTSIGNGAICSESNQIKLGNDNVTSLVCAGSATLNGVTVGRGGRGISTNVAIGGGSLISNTVGNYNTACGVQSLTSNTRGGNNTAIGEGSMYTNSSGSYNTATGFFTLHLNTIGSSNTAIGVNSLYTNSTGSNNTAVGYYSDAGSDLSNCTSIGSNAVCTDSNQITLGNADVSVLRCAVTSITAISDRRDKKDVEDLESSLEFIEQLKPVRFNWNMRDGGKVDIPEIGFIAQDLQQVQQDTGMKIPNLVYDVNPEKLEASYGALLPLLVKSIQELSQDNKRLNAKIQELIAKNQ